jgi:hypothetical protein
MKARRLTMHRETCPSFSSPSGAGPHAYPRPDEMRRPMPAIEELGVPSLDHGARRRRPVAAPSATARPPGKNRHPAERERRRFVARWLAAARGRRCFLPRGELGRWGRTPVRAARSRRQAPIRRRGARRLTEGGYAWTLFWDRLRRREEDAEVSFHPPRGGRWSRSTPHPASTAGAVPGRGGGAGRPPSRSPRRRSGSISIWPRAAGEVAPSDRCPGGVERVGARAFDEEGGRARGAASRDAHKEGLPILTSADRSAYTGAPFSPGAPLGRGPDGEVPRPCSRFTPRASRS